MPGFDVASRSKGLTMSSSSDTQLSTTTTSSSYKFKYTPTASYTNELQEVTSCTKETVRITPPPHDAVALRPTVFNIDNTPNGSPYQYNRNARSSSLPKMSADQRIADKECQTDDVIVYSSPSKITSHSVDTLSNDNVYSMSTLSVSLATPGHPNLTADQSSRELDHINVIVNEYQLSADNISCNSVDIGKTKHKKDKSGTDDTDNKVVYQVNLDKPFDKVDDEKVPDWDKEQNSCCDKCFLTAFQICDWCNIS